MRIIRQGVTVNVPSLDQWTRERSENCVRINARTREVVGPTFPYSVSGRCKQHLDHLMYRLTKYIVLSYVHQRLQWDTRLTFSGNVLIQ